MLCKIAILSIRKILACASFNTRKILLLCKFHTWKMLNWVSSTPEKTHFWWLFDIPSGTCLVPSGRCLQSWLVAWYELKKKILTLKLKLSGLWTSPLKNMWANCLKCLSILLIYWEILLIDMEDSSSCILF